MSEVLFPFPDIKVSVRPGEFTIAVFLIIQIAAHIFIAIRVRIFPLAAELTFRILTNVNISVLIMEFPSPMKLVLFEPAIIFFTVKPNQHPVPIPPIILVPPDIPTP
jgi:hypothetical protein